MAGCHGVSDNISSSWSGCQKRIVSISRQQHVHILYVVDIEVAASEDRVQKQQVWDCVEMVEQVSSRSSAYHSGSIAVEGGDHNTEAVVKCTKTAPRLRRADKVNYERRELCV